MDGKLYYSSRRRSRTSGSSRSRRTYPEPEQIKWVEEELKQSGEDWKIMFFHHPLYSSGGRHGSDLRLREALEPLFVQYNVSVGVRRPRSLLRTHQAAEGHHALRGRLGGQARSGGPRRAVRHHRERIRYRLRVPGRRNDRGPTELQHHLPHRRDRGFRNHPAPADGLARPAGASADSISPPPVSSGSPWSRSDGRSSSRTYRRHPSPGRPQGRVDGPQP